MTTITTENPQEIPTKLLVSKADAARMLSLSATEVDCLRRSGKLRAKLHGRKVLFPMAELEQYVARLPWELDQ